MKHIVIFTGGEHPLPSVFKKSIEKRGVPDLVIAADSGFDTALLCECVPNVVIGDMDSISSEEMLYNFPNILIERYPVEKDKTDTEMALEYAYKMKADYITLFGGDGGRLDHSLAIIKLFATEYFPNAWLCKMQKVICLENKGNNAYTDFLLTDFLKDSTISFYYVPETGEPHIESDGLFWSINNLLWKEGAMSLSNKLTSDCLSGKKPFSVRVFSGRFLVFMLY